jgi:hypothetical protein
LKEAQTILANAQKEGEPTEIAFAFHMLSHAQIDFQGPTGFNFSEEIEKSFTQSLVLYRELNERFYESQVLDWLSAVFYSLGLVYPRKSGHEVKRH